MIGQVALCMGTRPEIIKLAPVYHALVEQGLNPVVIHTGQHQEIADRLYEFFRMPPHARLSLDRKTSTLAELGELLLSGLTSHIERIQPSCVVVQGDTTTALMGGLAAVHSRIPVAHVEAGLRTWQQDPFPEEMNRTLLARIAAVHFPPTAKAEANLLSEGVAKASVHLVGNTVVDAVHWADRELRLNPDETADSEELRGFLNGTDSNDQVVLVTAHRRESWGAPLHRIAEAVGALLVKHSSLRVVWPVHPNPAVSDIIRAVIGALDEDVKTRICLTEPLDYPDLLRVLRRCDFTLTDSGGIQEEAATLRKPILIMRESTERQEVVDAGGARLVGTDRTQIIETATELLGNAQALSSMHIDKNPFGDGTAATQIAAVLTEQFVAGKERQAA